MSETRTRAVDSAQYGNAAATAARHEPAATLIKPRFAPDGLKVYEGTVTSRGGAPSLPQSKRIMAALKVQACNDQSACRLPPWRSTSGVSSPRIGKTRRPAASPGPWRAAIPAAMQAGREVLPIPCFGSSVRSVRTPQRVHAAKDRSPRVDICPGEEDVHLAQGTACPPHRGCQRARAPIAHGVPPHFAFYPLYAHRHPIRMRRDAACPCAPWCAIPEDVNPIVSGGGVYI